MRNIIRFLFQHHFTVLFIVLQIIAFSLIMSYNPYQRSAVISSSNFISGAVNKKASNVFEYFSLKKTNEKLSEENAFLKSRLPESFQLSYDYIRMATDSLKQRQYIYRSGKVINNSVTKKYNFLTIDKGLNQYIKSEMGVICPDGVVGIISNTSRNYSTAISILNTRLKISAKLKDTGFFGSIEWNGHSYQYVNLSDIPLHASVKQGDMVVTSGFSAIFPEGISIGTVEEVHLEEGDSFYQIKVRLSVDFKRLSYVEIIENQQRSEQLSLENRTEND